MLLKFSKMHGLGNDFAVVDAVSRKVYFNKEQIEFLGDRNRGIGFDQLLIVEPPTSPDMDFRYRIYNSNGSEVEHCGNGARCFAKFVIEKDLTNKSVINVETKQGQIQLHVQDDGEVTVDMGAPSFAPADLPFDATEKQDDLYTLNLEGYGSVELTPVSVGNPHAVIRVDRLTDEIVSTVGPLVESHSAFPANVNVGFMEVMSRDEVNLRVYERDVGETQACGTGTCAAIVAGIRQGWLNSKVTAHLLGGDLRIEWQGEGSPIMMTGPATKVFEGQIYL
ncbi:diaminopimelate epimerase [Marinomonas mediterranea]|uniref:Diaminopimelate epimerase n=1 Tax=Marinomonas mediterranea (strain ATCC 700492 / JCM 21426 / NBRC 103028 / MMB-1) TaxID=717774 RepID=F2K0S8_MARM1|nr:diaminopimelate epimerase [Marinomonas mediterranea]ADZ92170.1 Diaminopimelate epimerase [Marinomonas mediterranea MMB-1]WCN18232.1 diaminopimelate epimerase [Marinomonas mediterranea MMB-1]